MMLQQCTEDEIKGFVVKKSKEEDSRGTNYVYTGEAKGRLAGQEVILHYSIYKGDVRANLDINGQEVGYEGRDKNPDAIRLYHLLKNYNDLSV